MNIKKSLDESKLFFLKIIEKIEELTEKKLEGKKSEAFMGVENRVK